jgi:hypothetical protein
MNNLFGKPFAAIVPLIVGAALTAGAACAETTAPAPAANAPAPTVADVPPPQMAAPVAKKPRKRVTPSVVVEVTNARAVALTELDAAADGAAPKAIVSNLAPGKKKSVKVAHGKSCVFDLHGAYADGSTTDSASVDLCKDKSVNLVE